MYSELEIREKSPLSGLPFEVGPPLISYTKTQMHHWWGQLKLQDIIFLICNNKENWKSKRMNSFIMVSVSVVLVNILTFCYFKGTERIGWCKGWGPNKISTTVTILLLILIILITDVKWQNQWWALVASVSLLLIPHTICHSLLTLQSLWWHYTTIQVYCT